MQKPQVIAHFLVPPNRTPRKRFIQLWVRSTTQRRALKPASCLSTWASSPRARMWAVKPNSVQEVPHFVIVIAFVQTQPLGSVCRGLRPLHGDTLDGLPRQFEIIAIRSCHGEADGHPAAVGEDTAFGADTCRGQWGSCPPFSPQAWLRSSPRPSRATPSQCHARRHIPRGPVPIKATKTSASVHSWKRRWAALLEQIPCHVQRSATGSRCGGRKRWHPWLCDHRHGADGTPTECGLRGGSKGRMRSHNVSGIRQSSWPVSLVVRHH